MGMRFFCCGRQAAVGDHTYSKCLPVLFFFLPSCRPLFRLRVAFALHLGYIWVAAYWISVWLVCCTHPVMHITLVFAIFFSIGMCFLKIQKNHDLIS